MVPASCPVGAASARAVRTGSSVGPMPTTAPLRLRIAGVVAAQHRDRLHRFFPRGHLNEARATGPPTELIGDNTHRSHGPGVLEALSDVFCRSLEREIPDEGVS